MFNASVISSTQVNPIGQLQAVCRTEAEVCGKWKGAFYAVAEAGVAR
jgi:hypothetical protein